MAKWIGIDLGAANSVVALAGEHEDFPRFAGVAVVPDEYGRTIHVSAVSEHDGAILCGDDAARLADQGCTPVRYWKRFLGKDTPLQLGGKEYSPEDLATELLGYLKRVAETALQESVAGAVIAHPAWFDAAAVAAVRRAAERAGLHVGEGGLVPEPVAAALAFLHDDPRPEEDLRVLVYDLGGASLDVTVLERRHGLLRALGMDGDVELGGCSFDRALADHLLTHLRREGYQIDIDPSEPNNAARWAALMRVAEEAKLYLSQGPACAKVSIRRAGLFEDDAGRPVELSTTITRGEFEAMIAPMVDRTVECCRRALERADLTIGQIDRAIAVGGSSRLPLVRRRLAESFDREFEFDHAMADVCVAVGAALYAQSFSPAGGEGSEREPAAMAATCLPRSLYLETADEGLVPIAEAGQPLPLEVRLDGLETAGDEAAEITLAIYQEDTHLADLVLRDFSAPIRPGTPVDVTLRVGPDYSLSAEATIPSLGAAAEVRQVQMPLPPRPALAELREELARRREVLAEMFAYLPPGAERSAVTAEADKIITEAQALLDEPAPDVFRIQSLLRSLAQRTERHAPAQFQPSRAEMDALFARARQMFPHAAETGATSAQEEMARTLDALAEQADAAYEQRDQETWQSVAGRVEDLCAAHEPRSAAPAMPEPPALARMLKHHLAELEQKARDAGRSDDPGVRAAFQEASSALAAIDVAAPDAQQRLLAAFQQAIHPLETGLESAPRRAAGVRRRRAEPELPSIVASEGTGIAAPGAEALAEAVQLWEQDRVEEALAKASEVPESAAGHEQVRKLRAACHCRLGVEAANRGELDVGVEHLTQAASLDLDSAHIRQQLATARQLQAGQAHVRTLREAGQLLERGEVGRAHDVASQIPGSSAYYEQACDLMAACCNRLAVQAVDRGDFRAAAGHLRRARVLRPENATIRQNLQAVEQIVGTVRVPLAGAAPSKPSWLGRLFGRFRRAKPARLPSAGAARAAGGSRDDDTHLLRRGRPEMPTGTMDRVHFSLTSPPVMRPGGSYTLDVWAHLERQRREVMRRAREEAAGGEVRVKSRGPVKVPRGTILTVRLRVQDLVVEPSEDTILWEGEIGNATFAVAVPQAAAEGPRPGVATIHVDGFRTVRLAFVVEIGREALPRRELPTQQRTLRSAFASYAHEDRDAVLGRIHGIQKVAPDMDIFLDSKDLRSGEHWQKRLRQEIIDRDVLYLFWSRAASRSEWVEWEWRCALRERGIDFIDPVPLVSPEAVPPPKELADQIHFNDWVLAYMSGAGPSRRDA